MVGPQTKKGLTNLSSLANELPKKARSSRSSRIKRPADKKLAVTNHSDAPAFPDCFNEITRRAGSKDPNDVRQRAALEALASTLSPSARAATGAQAAGVYLASLVVALNQVLSSVSHTGKNADAATNIVRSASKKKISKKNRRIQQVRDEENMKNMTAMDARDLETKQDSEMTAMDAISEVEDPKSVSEDSVFIASIVYLISLAVKAASPALINAKAKDILAPINVALSLPSPSPLLPRHAAGAITIVLSSLNHQSWKNISSDISASYLNLLSVSVCTAPKNRRKGRESLLAILRKVPLNHLSTSCAPASVAWFHRTTNSLARECVENAAKGSKETFNKSYTRLLHHITVFRYFSFILSDVESAKIGKQILTIALKNIPEVLPFLYNALAFLFCIPNKVVDGTGLLLSRHVDMIPESFGYGIPSPKTLLGGLVPRISLSDGEKLLAAIIASSLPPSATIDTRTSRARALVTVSISLYSYFPHVPPPAASTVSVIRSLIEDIDPVALSSFEVKRLSIFLHELIKQKEVMNAPEVFGLLEPFSHPKYKNHWNSLLPIFKELLSSGSLVSKSSSSENVVSFVDRIVKMRNVAFNSKDHSGIDLAHGLLSAIVRGGGAPYLLKLAPIQVDEKALITNAWVVGILRDNIRHTPLSLWKSLFAPVHQQLEAKAKKMAGTENGEVECKNVKIYSYQLLSLLPGFCTNPPDLAHSQSMNAAFESIHYCMTFEDQAVQLIGCNALRTLSETILSRYSDVEGPSTGVRSSFCSRLKKLFSTCLDLAGKLVPGKRNILLQTITTACQASADGGLVVSLLRKTIRLFLEVAAKNDGEGEPMDIDLSKRNLSARLRHASSDVAVSIVESGVVPKDASELSLLKRAVLPSLRSKEDVTLQKKAYKAILVLTNAGAFSNSLESIDGLIQEIADSAAEVAAGAVSSRLATVQAIIDLYSEDGNMAVIEACTKAFFAESILALHENSGKSRSSGINLCKAMGNAWSKNNKLDVFFVHIAAGLGGRSSAMISGSLVAVTSFLQDYKNEIREDGPLGSIVDSMFAQVTESEDTEMADADSETKGAGTVSVSPGPIAILLRHDALEVQRAAIGVLKVAIGTLGSPLERLMKLIPGFLPSLIAAATFSRKKEIRLRVKVVIERLLRKCGREVMEGLFPEEHKRLLSSVRKAHEKEKMKKLEKKGIIPQPSTGSDSTKRVQINVNEEDDDDDDEFSGDSDDEVEFLDGNELIMAAAKKRALSQGPKSSSKRNRH